MKINDEEAIQQQRQRGFWARLKNPKTLKTVFWCGKIIYQIIKFLDSGGDGPD